MAISYSSYFFIKISALRVDQYVQLVKMVQDSKHSKQVSKEFHYILSNLEEGIVVASLKNSIEFTNQIFLDTLKAIKAVP